VGRKVEVKVFKVLIDPGHGPGNVNGGRNGYKESLLGQESINITQNYIKTSLAAIKAAHDKIMF
jgi:hypothetical protein